MIKVESYINVGHGLTKIEDARSPPPNHRYIEGSLNLEVNNEEIIDKIYVDYIDQIWSYIIDCLVQVNDGLNCDMYYPDQPFHIEFKIIDSALLKINCAGGDYSKSCTVGKCEFICTMAKSSLLFFMYLTKLVPARKLAYADVINKATFLQNYCYT